MTKALREAIAYKVCIACMTGGQEDGCFKLADEKPCEIGLDFADSILSLIRDHIQKQTLTDEEIETAHENWTYDHENEPCAGTLEKRISNATISKVVKSLEG